MALTDTFSKFFDLIFAVGFAFLAVWSIFFIDTEDKTFTGIAGIVMIAYYIFFTGFMTCSFIQLKVLHEYCGFLKSVASKTFFYLFLTSLGFASVTSW